MAKEIIQVVDFKGFFDRFLFSITASSVILLAIIGMYFITTSNVVFERSGADLLFLNGMKVITVFSLLISIIMNIKEIEVNVRDE